MSEMIKRVAKAIIFVQEGPCDPETVVRAAIEAMREPTDDMVDAGDMWADGPGYSAKVWNAMIEKALK